MSPTAAGSRRSPSTRSPCGPWTPGAPIPSSSRWSGARPPRPPPRRPASATVVLPVTPGGTDVPMAVHETAEHVLHHVRKWLEENGEGSSRLVVATRRAVAVEPGADLDLAAATVLGAAAAHPDRTPRPDRAGGSTAPPVPTLLNRPRKTWPARWRSASPKWPCGKARWARSPARPRLRPRARPGPSGHRPRGHRAHHRRNRRARRRRGTSPRDRSRRTPPAARQPERPGRRRRGRTGGRTGRAGRVRLRRRLRRHRPGRARRTPGERPRVGAAARRGARGRAHGRRRDTIPGARAAARGPDAEGRRRLASARPHRGPGPDGVRPLLLRDRHGGARGPGQLRGGQRLP
ncbi:hypothetical protein SALBM135S_07767 [Streptomyces alboniger]